MAPAGGILCLPSASVHTGPPRGQRPVGARPAVSSSGAPTRSQVSRNSFAPPLCSPPLPPCPLPTLPPALPTVKVSVAQPCDPAIPRAVARQALCPGDSGVGGHFLLQGIFPTQGSNLGLLHCRQILYCLRQQGRPLPGGIQQVSLLLQAEAQRLTQFPKGSSLHECLQSALGNAGWFQTFRQSCELQCNESPALPSLRYYPEAPLQSLPVPEVTRASQGG